MKIGQIANTRNVVLYFLSSYDKYLTVQVSPRPRNTATATDVDSWMRQRVENCIVCKMLSCESDRTIEINLETIENLRLTTNDIAGRIEQLKANGQFDKRRADELSYQNFFINYLQPNIPVIITGISQGWECMNWTRNNQDTSDECGVDFSYLSRKFSDCVKVPVADCEAEYFNSHKKLELSFPEFIDYWRKRVQLASDADDLPCDKAESLLYLKDWHLRRELPNYEFYRTPLHFGSDWLNEYCEQRGIDDYRFVYMGPKGTW